MRSFPEIKYLGLGRLPTRAITFQEIEILHILAYSSLFGQKNGSFEFQLDVLHISQRRFA